MKIDKKIKEVNEKFNQEISVINSIEDLENIKNKYLSRKGLVSELFSELGTLDALERPKFGNILNDLKLIIDQKISSIENKFKQKNNQDEDLIDITLPGKINGTGCIHPLTKVISQIESIFTKIGFSIAYGPEVDSDFFNFEALNIPQHHPARDMQDTFYLNDGHVLRTHTSNSQIHFMLNNKPPIRIIAPGRVYRNEDVSVRSYCLFHQIEGLYVDKNVTFSDLKSVLNYFARELFGNNVKTRFRPSYFPFTEPSAEMDVYWGLESESDRRITKGTGWLEILGCGMVDPEVFKNVEYDSSKLTGYAFGVGIERIAMLLYGIEDIREFYKGDIRFTGQFK
jgi:phenylalanyl-tRNA synthetase alpha chain